MSPFVPLSRSHESSDPRRLPGPRGAVFASVLAAGLLLLPASDVAGQASLLTPFGSEPGISSCDDCNVEVPLTAVFPVGINLGGSTYTSLFIGSNGYITFGHGNDSFSPMGIAAYTQGPIVAAQFDDLDPRNGSGRIWYNQDVGSDLVVVTFENVEPWTTPVAGSGSNSYQIVLRRLPGGDPTDFQIELRYHRLSWARSGNNSAWPTAGWSMGNLNSYAEPPQSGQSTFQQLVSTSNVGSAGIWRWNVEGGVVEAAPTVNQTTLVTAITAVSAQSGGNISSDGGLPVTDRGLVWSTSPGPIWTDPSVSAGEGIGAFSATMTGLAPLTTYYVRAYATNTHGTAYGPTRTFTTPAGAPPTVTTATTVSIGTHSATAGGTVTDDGGVNVTVRGVALGASPDPTTADLVVSAGSGEGAFTAPLSELSPGTTYHVRAFATNAIGTSYGANTTFTTERLDQVITHGIPDAATYGEAPIPNGTASTSGLPVRVESSDRSVVAVNAQTLVFTGAGDATITLTQMGNTTWNPAPPVEVRITVAPRAVQGHFEVVDARVFDASLNVQVTHRSLSGVLPADDGDVQLSGGEGMLDSLGVGPAQVVRLVGAELSGSRAAHYTLAGVDSTTTSILPGPADHLTLEAPDPVPAGAHGVLRLVLRDAWGHATLATGDHRVRFQAQTEAATAGFADTDGTPLDRGQASIEAGTSELELLYRNTRVGPGLHHVRVTPTDDAGPDATTGQVRVVSGPAAAIVVAFPGLEPGATPVAGVPFLIELRAVDAHGNTVEDFDGQVLVSSDPPLLTGAGATGSFTRGVLTGHEVGFTGSGAHRLSIRWTMDGEEHEFLTPPIEIRDPAPRVELEVEIDNDRPALGDEILITLTLVNHGETDALDLVVRDLLGTQFRLERIDWTPSHGTLDPTSGAWRVDLLEAGAQATLVIRARVRIPE